MSHTVSAAMMRGPGLIEVEQFPRPIIDADFGLLRVEATGLVGADYEFYSETLPAEPRSTTHYPFIPGHIIVGHIEEVGASAKRRWRVQEGDRVLLQYNITCGYCPKCLIGEHRACENLLGYGLYSDFTKPPYLWGGAAELMVLHPNTKMVRVPDQASITSALLVERFADACNWLLDKGRLSARDSITILGTGALAQTQVVVAKLSGCAPVIAVARPTSGRIEHMRELGADHVFTGSHDEVVASIAEVTAGRMTSVVVDSTNTDAATPLAMKLLAAHGRLIQVAMKRGGPMDGIYGPDLIQKELTIIGVRGHDFEHLQWAISCFDRPACSPYLQSKVAQYRLGDIRTALERSPSMDGATLAAINP